MKSRLSLLIYFSGQVHSIEPDRIISSCSRGKSFAYLQCSNASFSSLEMPVTMAMKSRVGGVVALTKAVELKFPTTRSIAAWTGRRVVCITFSSNESFRDRWLRASAYLRTCSSYIWICSDDEGCSHREQTHSGGETQIGSEAFELVPLSR